MPLIYINKFFDRFEREKKNERLSTLSRKYSKNYTIPEKETFDISDNLIFFSECALRAGLKSGKSLLVKCLGASLILSLITFFIKPILIVAVAPIGFFIPIYNALSQARARTLKFSEEYPVILLATASNMKAGLTVYNSLERAIMLLPEDSEMKKEVKYFLEKISRGVPKDQAIAEFAKYIALPELDLFRRAFNLVLGHGGKFSRTLERLAQVCRDRENLIKSARVSTASMRMTANILLGVSPVLVGVMSLRSPEYWSVLFNSSIASSIALIGTLVILSSYVVLRFMSDFKA